MSSLIRIDPSGICSTSAGRPVAAAPAPRPPGAPVRARQEALHERFVARHATSIRTRHHDAIAARRRSVPRTMLGDDRRVLVAGRKHVAGVEREANRRHVRAELLDGRLGRRTRALCAELRVCDVALMAEREAEVEAGLRRRR